MKQKILIVLVAVIIFLGIVISYGYNTVHKRNAFEILKSVYNNHQSISSTECPYFIDCLNDVFDESQKKQIAYAYGVLSNKSSDYSNIYLGLTKGSSINPTGIGTGYLKNLKKLDIKMDRWYWEIGSCPNNKRIFVDALTGKAGVLHNYVYCSKAEDPLPFI